MKFLRGIMGKLGGTELGTYIRGELRMEEIQNQIMRSRFIL
jgi:hypothetical protein